MYFYKADLSISFNTVKDNPSGVEGIEMSGGSPWMSSNVVKSNGGDFGVYLYANSDPTLVYNKIGYNNSCGLKLYNGSDPVMNYYYSAENAFEGNGSYELYLRENCQPPLDYGHNDIVHPGTGWHIYIDTNYSWSTIYARGNWWGDTDSTTFKLHPNDGVIYSPWDTSPNTGGVGKIVASNHPAAQPSSDAYNLLFLSIELKKEEQYSQASELYKGVLTKHPYSPAARPALSGLLSAHRVMGGDLLALRSYFEELHSRYAGIGLGRKGRWLSIDCLELSGDYKGAIAEYQKLRSEGGEEGLAAALRMGEVYLYGLRDLAQARKVFEEIILDAPESEAACMASGHLAELKALPQILSEPKPKVTKVSGEKPAEVSLSQNWPNPFNAQTMISYGLQKPAFVQLEICNVLGQKVRTLVEGHVQSGFHSVVWDGRDEGGRNLSSGIYLCRLVVDGKRLIKIRKMMLLK